ncbi:MAG: aminoglycoside phosphotransferase [Gammaproteobacteria bacterium RBG_16_57_12]|nr:MAG: aminoglycoside phosphotransferase [Gammaproteobacteria bacterium RBG_16_57_12]
MDRFAALTRWVVDELGYSRADLRPASSDASFRRYFRFHDRGIGYIVMDAPTDKEDIRPYIHVAELMLAIGLHVPEILARNPGQGFLLLSDLGTSDYLSRLTGESVNGLYGDALEALMRLQLQGAASAGELPDYDEALLQREMRLFPEWYLGTHLGITPDANSTAVLEQTFALLCRSALEQPRVFVHRDYHSRNLMVTPENNPGILDFQDAVHGPVTYDLVSLLRDCYVAWPREQVERWVMDYLGQMHRRQYLRDCDEQQFLRWFDLMGVQRHLKAIGIFARLNHRDGKPGYLKDIPRTLGYVIEVCSRYPELAAFREFLAAQVRPRLGVPDTTRRSSSTGMS